MKEIIVKISDEKMDQATQLLEKLGAEIKEKKVLIRKPKIKKSKNAKKIAVKKVKKKRLSEKISPTYLFGKWKNLDIDAKKLRKEAWDRSHKYL